MSGTVVVIGPSTYLGAALVSRLLESGHRVVGVSPRPAMARIFLPDESDMFTVVAPGEALGLIEEPKACSIVSTAEIGDVPTPRLLSRDRRTRAGWRRRVIASIEEVAAHGCRHLIHLSTSAVFGAEPPMPGRVHRKPMEDRDAESQLMLEHAVESLASKLRCELAIVRAGNVVGPGSPIWVAGVAQRVMEMKPVGYAGTAGFSNATHVDNAAAYLAGLVRQPAGALRDFGTFHHLAEFSSHRWPELLDVMSDVVGLAWNVATRPPPAGRPASQAARLLLKSGYRSAPSAYLRAGVGMLPDWRAFDLLPRSVEEPPPEAAVPAADPAEVALLDILAASREFASHTVPDWSPGLDFDAACGGIAEWLRNSGYEMRAAP